MPDIAVIADWVQVFGLPLAVIAILISVGLAVWTVRRTTQRRALACQFSPIVFPVQTRAFQSYRDVEIHTETRYKGQPVHDIFLVQVKMKNVGNLDICRSDVVQPVTFTFGKDVKILAKPETLSRNPDNLQLSWLFPETAPDSKPNATSLEFELLNPGDEFATELVCSGEAALPQVTTRIRGIARVKVLPSIETHLDSEGMVSSTARIPFSKSTVVSSIELPHYTSRHFSSFVPHLFRWCIYSVLIPSLGLFTRWLWSSIQAGPVSISFLDLLGQSEVPFLCLFISAETLGEAPAISENDEEVKPLLFARQALLVILVLSSLTFAFFGPPTGIAAQFSAESPPWTITGQGERFLASLNAIVLVSGILTSLAARWIYFTCERGRSL